MHWLLGFVLFWIEIKNCRVGGLIQILKILKQEIYRILYKINLYCMCSVKGINTIIKELILGETGF